MTQLLNQQMEQVTQTSQDSQDNSYPFVTVDQFTPNLGQWQQLGAVSTYQQSGTTIRLVMAQGPGPILYFYAPTLFRVRFNSAGDYSADNSYAVVNTDFGFSASSLQVQDNGAQITIQTGVLEVVIQKATYALAVYRSGQLIHQDTSSYNLVYTGECVANFKVYPANAMYFGFGEKAGAQLAKNQFTMTFFNFDNFTYATSPLPAGEEQGPLNPSEALYNSVPLLIEVNPNPTGANQGSPYAYGIFFDNVAQSYINIGASDYSNMYGKYYFGALYGDLNYYFMAGSVAADVVQQYTQLTGTAPMPPKYVFGYHQGCYGYYDQYHVMAVANAYRAAQIPCDGLHIDVDFQNNYRTFTHSNLKFPDAQAMFSYLALIGFKCSTNITALVDANPYDENGHTGPGSDPYLALESGLTEGVFITNSRAGQPATTDLFVGNENYGVNTGINPYPAQPDTGSDVLGSYGYYPDFGRPEVQEWWGKQYQNLFDIGLQMVWQDMTDPALSPGVDNPATYKTFPGDLLVTSFGEQVPSAKVHNSYALLLSQSTYEGLSKIRPDMRNFIIARGGYAGIQRYAGLWTGDSASSWDFLQINVPEVLNLGLSGIPISGCDIGGFANGSASEGDFYVTDGRAYGQITNYELFTRWMTLGAFLPWFRNHYDGYSKGFQEPYNYGEPVPSNCRKYIEMRYQLIQLFYDAMYQCTQTGMPIARAMLLTDPQDPNVYSHLDDQYFVGQDLLVAPILFQAETASPPVSPTRDIYLPAGWDWYPYQNNEEPLPAPAAGGQTIRYYAPLSQVMNILPMYVRAGAILPSRQVEQWVGQLDINPLTLSIYPGPNRQYALYLDDGLTTAYQTSKAYRLTEVSTQTSGNQKTVSVVRTFDNYTPKEPYFFVALLSTSNPQTVTVNGQALSNLTSTGGDQAGADALSSSAVNAYYFNVSLQTTFIKVYDSSANLQIVSTF